jgi:osmotically-inducible protein OsmY
VFPLPGADGFPLGGTEFACWLRLRRRESTAWSTSEPPIGSSWQVRHEQPQGDEMLNHDLERSVQDELMWDPMIDASAIAVTADDDGRVTLRGTVGTYSQKFMSASDAKRIFGVTAVDNKLEVDLLATRDDDELRGEVLQALMLNSLVPSTVDATVDDGFITLTGTADWQFQRDEAESAASSIEGIRDMFDDIALKPRPSSIGIEESIAAAFKRNAGLDAGQLSVSTSDGTVTIRGDVRSWAEHDQALAAAWAAPGVSNVDDRINITY